MNDEPGRRKFLETLAMLGGVGRPRKGAPAVESHLRDRSPMPQTARAAHAFRYPRRFTGPALAMISFPLGGVAAGSIGLGGRGQLRDWEIANRADKGKSPAYAFPAIWVQAGAAAPVAHVLEARLEPPYEGEDGLGSKNAPGLSRLAGATFQGEFPLARVDFHDVRLPVQVSLNAWSPFIPLDADASGMPGAVLRYRVQNTGSVAASVSIAFSIDNPVLPDPMNSAGRDGRVNRLRSGAAMEGIEMGNAALGPADPLNGECVLAVLTPPDGTITRLAGWPAGRWWNSPLLFWDDFTQDGRLGPASEKANATGAVCLNRKIAPGEHAEYTFILAWRFPNRTPRRCGWHAPKGQEDTVIGNWYATRFADAWSVAEHITANLPALERRTMAFVTLMREATLPAPVKEAALANLSTLVTTTCFRTADGEFHGFEGVNDHLGCCFGNCTHVWNYETATSWLFPTLARSLRRSAFGYSMDDRGAMYFRQLLPDGLERYGTTAADGQMGQIIRAYLDWQLSGDPGLLREFWPKVKRAIEFAWVPGGWDANRDGVLEGVQHNTYDVEFYGPNPLCGILYLGALRAAEEMARAAAEREAAAEYRRLFEQGRAWIDEHLFNGEYYVQVVAARKANSIAAGLRSGMGADDPEHPQYQLGTGCLVDQLMGQYLADVAGLGPLLDTRHIATALRSIYRYNHKPTLFEHDNVQRTFALNDEAALVICDYAKRSRPEIPFPYYAEVMTGFEYTAAVLMLCHGMMDEGLSCIADIRHRYDGVRRNPWDEAECGHHYARAMASWSGVATLTGFHYRGPERALRVEPKAQERPFRGFWSTGTGWGRMLLAALREGIRLQLEVVEGFLAVRAVTCPGAHKGRSSVRYGVGPVEHRLFSESGAVRFGFAEELRCEPGQELVLAA